MKGTARVRALLAAGTLEDQQGGRSDRVREVRRGGGQEGAASQVRTVWIDLSDGKPVYKGRRQGPSKIHFTKITLTAE